MSKTEEGALIRLSRASLGEAEQEAVRGVIERDYLGMGADTKKFESELSAFFGRPAVCVANGTAALQLALQGCGIGPGDEVLVPSLTFVASFQAVRANGATPVACEIDPNECTLDVADAERRLTSRTKAVMPVHYTGGVGTLDAVYDFANRHGLRVIEDAAHAFGTTHNGARVGSFGDVSCFSFDGIKNITCGEGGCVVSSDADVIRIVQDARLLGIERDTEKRYTGQRSWEFDVTFQGWRYHMSNLMAAIGIAQLGHFPEMAATRQRLARRYDGHFAGHSRIRPVERDYATVVPHIYVVRVKGLGERATAQASLLAAGIETGVHYQPNHTLTLFRDPKAAPFPVTDAVFSELLTLPLHAGLTEADVDRVCKTMSELFG